MKKEQAVQGELDSLRTNLAKLEQSKKIKENTVKEHKSKVREINRELASLGSGGVALEGVEQDLRSAVSVVMFPSVFMHKRRYLFETHVISECALASVSMYTKDMFSVILPQ